MSLAGVFSNRGDFYQLLIAANWAITVALEPEYLWMEVDSLEYPVDDIVLGKANGELICCQCKKNQSKFGAWTIEDLSDELVKAAALLATHPNSRVHFYSRSPFGVLTKLQELAAATREESAFQQALTRQYTRPENELRKLLTEYRISPHQFLARLTVNVTEDFERYEETVKERMRGQFTNGAKAFEGLYALLHRHSASATPRDGSTAAAGKLTRQLLLEKLQKLGAIAAPTIEKKEIARILAGTSSIGRNWKRDIQGVRLKSPIEDEILDAIREGVSSILVTGTPGSGKTCLLLSVLETIEREAANGAPFAPVFIQSREFADFETVEQRAAQGLDPHWVEHASRLAEFAHTLIVIDSLDVLSIGREHAALTYFLAQIDRLLSIPNVTVLTSCRAFDRGFDSRLASRTWGLELSCPPLDWSNQVLPLLEKLGIQTSEISQSTQELIRTARDLDLFVGLALESKPANFVSSYALAQAHLDYFVGRDPALGDEAMQLLERAAVEMMANRSLSLRQERLPASTDVIRALRSRNVLGESSDGRITFGHQSLLDTLVIRGAFRAGQSLAEFIGSLPLVPFVRPSIRAFVEQLAATDKRMLRKEARTTLFGQFPFSVRRLIGESISGMVPDSEDWPLLRDLRNHQKDVFNVIYRSARAIEWNDFWITHLVPDLKRERDAEGLRAHIHLTTRWANVDAERVYAFFLDVLRLDWMRDGLSADGIAMTMSEAAIPDPALAAELINELLKLPRDRHSFLGRAIARNVSVGAVEDELLWNYIAGTVTTAVLEGHDFSAHLHCEPHEFGASGEKFLPIRMRDSVRLLDLAIASVEEWSRERVRIHGAWIRGRTGFLGATSQRNAHEVHQFNHKDSEHHLFGAIEFAILDHGVKRSTWWTQNRTRLSSSEEPALQYFALKVCLSLPQENLDLVAAMLKDRRLIESDLAHEACLLAHAAFYLLPDIEQDSALDTILGVFEDDVELRHDYSIRRHKCLFIKAIPGYLRSSKAQELLDAFENEHGPIVLRPEIHARSGSVVAPFSSEVFSETSNAGVLRLLAHYSGDRPRSFDSFLVGGREEVGRELSAAVSSNPERFLAILSQDWALISDGFCDRILEGAGDYLEKGANEKAAVAKKDEAVERKQLAVVNMIADELDLHPAHWSNNHSAARALYACARHVRDVALAERLAFHAVGFAAMIEGSAVRGDRIDLVTDGINMAKGKAAESLAVIANNFVDWGLEVPQIVSAGLLTFAADAHAAIRGVVLRRLPFLLTRRPELGWRIYDLAVGDYEAGIADVAEQCLYYTYRNHQQKVERELGRLKERAEYERNLETWGRISALISFGGQATREKFLAELDQIELDAAWKGAAAVWTNLQNASQVPDVCFEGIRLAFRHGGAAAAVVAQEVADLFRTDPVVDVPDDIVTEQFRIWAQNNEAAHHVYFFGEWLAEISARDPHSALASAHAFADYATVRRPHLFDHENGFTKTLTQLFRLAEELEGVDGGKMLGQVVSLQDKLLSVGLDSIDEWLKAAERP